MKEIEEIGLNFYDLRLKWRKIFEDFMDFKEKILWEEKEGERDGIG